MHPILFSIGPINVYTYGFTLALAFLTAIWLTSRAAEREGIKREVIIELGTYVLIAAIVGARAGDVIINWDYYWQHPLDIVFSRQGFVFYGGFILGVMVSVLFILRRKLPLWKMADIISPSIAIGLAIGRIGCFCFGCCYGKPTESTIGVVFPSGSPAHIHFGDQPVHPTQLYSSANGLALFLILLFIRQVKGFEGRVFVSFLFLYSLARFVIEEFRGDNPELWLGLTPSQWVSIGGGMAAVVLYKMLRKRGFRYRV
ncbi:MAG: prolipoprotein diacylglyceryl transferase [bacterium]